MLQISLGELSVMAGFGGLCIVAAIVGRVFKEHILATWQRLALAVLGGGFIFISGLLLFQPVFSQSAPPMQTPTPTITLTPSLASETPSESPTADETAITTVPVATPTTTSANGAGESGSSFPWVWVFWGAIILSFFLKSDNRIFAGFDVKANYLLKEQGKITVTIANTDWNMMCCYVELASTKVMGKEVTMGINRLDWEGGADEAVGVKNLRPNEQAVLIVVLKEDKDYYIQGAKSRKKLPTARHYRIGLNLNGEILGKAFRTIPMLIDFDAIEEE